jgi:hypothetical protein
VASKKVLEDGSLAVKEKCYSNDIRLRKIKGRAYEYEVVAVEVAATLPGSIRLGCQVFY